jgi:hypothetical protein
VFSVGNSLLTRAEETEDQNQEHNSANSNIKEIVLPSESDDAQHNSRHWCRDEQQEAQLDKALRRKVDSPSHDSNDGSKARVAGMKLSVVRDRAEHVLAQQNSAQDHHGGGKRNADAKNYRNGFVEILIAWPAHQILPVMPL